MTTVTLSNDDFRVLAAVVRGAMPDDDDIAAGFYPFTIDVARDIEGALAAAEIGPVRHESVLIMEPREHDGIGILWDVGSDAVEMTEDQYARITAALEGA